MVTKLSLADLMLCFGDIRPPREYLPNEPTKADFKAASARLRRLRNDAAYEADLALDDGNEEEYNALRREWRYIHRQYAAMCAWQRTGHYPTKAAPWSVRYNERS